MKRSDWILIIVPLFLVWAVDHFTKIWSTTLTAPLEFGILKIRLYHNHGAFLGFFSDLPPLLRIVSLSTIGSFLVFSYAIVQYLLPIKSVNLRLGMSILLGGIVGNVTDRILWGYVVDFIVLETPYIPLHPLNLADIFQWVGYGFVAFALVKEDEILWPEQNNRKRLWIYPNYQFRYIFFLLIIALSLTLIGSVFSYTYLKVTIFELIGENKFIPKRFLIPYIFTYFTISSIFCGFLIIIGRRVSHRNAGPIYAFNKYVDDLLEGRNRKFKLRAGDEFKQLESIGLKLSAFLQENNLIDREDLEKVLTSIPPTAEDLSIGAIPADGQIPDYKTTRTNQFIRTTIRDNQIPGQIMKFRDCPTCGTSSLQSKPSDVAEFLVECNTCHLTYDPRTQKPQLATAKAKTETSATISNELLDYREIAEGGRTHDLKDILNDLMKDNPSYKRILYYGPHGLEFKIAAENPSVEALHIIVPEDAPALNLTSEGVLKILKGSLRSIAEELESYDLILLDQTLEREQQPESFIELATTFVLSGGVLWLRTANIKSKTAHRTKLNWAHLFEYVNVTFFDENSLHELLAKKGLEIKNILPFKSTFSLQDLREDTGSLRDSWMRKWLFFIPRVWAKKLNFKLDTGLLVATAQVRPQETNS